MEAPALLHHPSRHEIGVTVHLAEELPDVAEGNLDDVLAQVADAPGAVEALVDEVAVAVTQVLLIEELRLAVVGIPAAMPDPAAEEEIPARHEIGVGVGAAAQEARISSRISGVARSSLSRLKIQSCVAWATASLRSLPNASNLCWKTLSVNSRAMAAVASVLKESTTMSSSAHARLSRQARMFGSSL